MLELTAADVRKVVGTHGYAFQYAVLRAAERLANSRQSPWMFEAAEYPVGTAEAPVHVDFILRGLHSNAFIVAECKRSDPGRSRWCFVQTPYARRDAQNTELFFQQVRPTEDGNYGAWPYERYASIAVANLAFETRSAEKGDGVGSGGAFREAITQVLRGMNGLIDDMFVRRRTALKDPPAAVFVPAIFTTASLFVVQGDIAEADLVTGRLPDEWGEVQPVEWLWYTHNQSPSLVHHLDAGVPQPQELSKVLRNEYARTIAIISPAGVEKFLSHALLNWL